MSALGQAWLAQHEAVIRAMDDDDFDVLLALRNGGASRGPDPILTTTTAAERAGVSPKSVRRGIDAGHLDANMVAGRWQLTPVAVDDWRARGCPTTTIPRVAPVRHRSATRLSRMVGATAILHAGSLDG